MAKSSSKEHRMVLVDFARPVGTVKQVSLSPVDLAEKSAVALDTAMETIKVMAHRVFDAVDALANRPAQVEVEFGIKLEAEAGALVARTAAEASINVTLTWER